MIRQKIAHFAIALVLICRLASADEVFKSTWTASDAEPINFKGKKVVALVLTKNRAARAAAEELLADQLKARGAEGIAGGTLVEESVLTDRDKVLALLKSAGVAGAIVVRPVLAGGKQADPNISEDPQYRRFMGFSSEPAPDGEKKVPFFVEALVYSLDQDKLLWSGKSATKAATVEELINTVVIGVGVELSKAGLLPKK